MAATSRGVRRQTSPEHRPHAGIGRPPLYDSERRRIPARPPRLLWSADLRRLLRLAGERQSENADGEGDCERGAWTHHAATGVCWVSIAAIFRRPSILRNLLCTPRSAGDSGYPAGLVLARCYNVPVLCKTAAVAVR